MSRNLHEEWEQRKTYLIRSLFQEIPLLSPVPENDESRQSSRSPVPEPPEDVAPVRPESPLPPLIIERMPNRHDDPPEFYVELEKKIKKIYKKIFFGEEDNWDEELLNSDDLEGSFNDIEMEKDDQGAEPTTTSLPYERDHSDYVTAHEEIITRHSTSQSESTSKSPSHKDSDVNNDYLRYGEGDAAIAEKSDDTSSTVNDDIGDTQITAEVVVHEANKAIEEETITSHSTSRSESTSKSLSHKDSDVNNDYLRYGEGDAAIAEKSDDTSSTVNDDIGDTQITAEVVVHEANKAIEEETITSHSTSRSESTSKSLSHKDSDVNNDYLHYGEGDAAIAEKTDDTSSTVNGDIVNTQITAEVAVHEANRAIEVEEHIEDVQVRHEDLNKCTSPIIMLKTKLIQVQIQELHQDTENVSSHNKSDAEQEDEEVSQDESCSYETDLNVSHRSVELIRRQEIISPSLGSLQYELDETTTSEKSRGTEITGFKRKTSFALHEEEDFWVQHDAAKEFLLSEEIAHDFHNLSTVMSPIPNFYFNRSSTTSEYANDAASRSTGGNNIPMAKRSKYEHVGIQTSTIEEDNETVNWDSLKSNFFVGTPKIFKLCSCHDHKCAWH